MQYSIERRKTNFILVFQKMRIFYKIYRLKFRTIL